VLTLPATRPTLQNFQVICNLSRGSTRLLLRRTTGAESAVASIKSLMKSEGAFIILTNVTWLAAVVKSNAGVRSTDLFAVSCIPVHLKSHQPYCRIPRKVTQRIVTLNVFVGCGCL